MKHLTTALSGVNTKLGTPCCNRVFMEAAAILNTTANHLKHPIL